MNRATPIKSKSLGKIPSSFISPEKTRSNQRSSTFKKTLLQPHLLTESSEKDLDCHIRTRKVYRVATYMPLKTKNESLCTLEEAKSSGEKRLFDLENVLKRCKDFNRNYNCKRIIRGGKKLRKSFSKLYDDVEKMQDPNLVDKKAFESWKNKFMKMHYEYRDQMNVLERRFIDADRKNGRHRKCLSERIHYIS